VEWAVDGGVTVENIGLVSAAGADIAIVGRGIFGNGQIRENIRAMKFDNTTFNVSENGRGLKGAKL
jgi:pentose-5-phosphate-3-epimerase